MFFTDLFNLHKKCNHNKVSPNLEFAYCPDCGKLIKNEWYVTRCACCGVKLKTIIKNDEIIPAYNYCSNCGCNEYVIEKIPKINFIDIHYAVLKRTIHEDNSYEPVIQSWQEKIHEKPKLLVQY